MRMLAEVAFCGAAVGLFAWVVQALGWRRGLGLSERPPDAALPPLVLYGPFRRVRHPRALALLCALAAGASAWRGTWWLAGLAAVVVLWQARRDDARLAVRFGEAYARYRRVVPFMLPRWS